MWTCPDCGTKTYGDDCEVCGFDFDCIEYCDGCDSYVPGSQGCVDCEMEG